MIQFACYYATFITRAALKLRTSRCGWKPAMHNKQTSKLVGLALLELHHDVLLKTRFFTLKIARLVVFYG